MPLWRRRSEPAAALKPIAADVVFGLDQADAAAAGVERNPFLVDPNSRISGLTDDAWERIERVSAELAEAAGVGQFEIGGCLYRSERKIRIHARNGAKPRFSHENNTFFTITVDGVPLDRWLDFDINDAPRSVQDLKLGEVAMRERAALHFNQHVAELVQAMTDAALRSVNRKTRELALSVAKQIGLELSPVVPGHKDLSKRGTLRALLQEAATATDRFGNLTVDAIGPKGPVALDSDDFLRVSVRSIGEFIAANKLSGIAGGESLLRLANELKPFDVQNRHRSESPHYTGGFLMWVNAKEPTGLGRYTGNIGSMHTQQMPDWRTLHVRGEWSRWPRREAWVAEANQAFAELSAALELPGPKSRDELRVHLSEPNINTLDASVGLIRVMHQTAAENREWIRDVASAVMKAVEIAANQRPFTVALPGGATYRGTGKHNYTRNGQKVEALATTSEAALVQIVEEGPALLFGLHRSVEIANDALARHELTAAAVAELDTSVVTLNNAQRRLAIQALDEGVELGPI